FWRWLERSDTFSWRRPLGWHDLKVRVQRLPADSQRLTHIQTFTVDDLVTLYRNATPLVRVFLLLGLNCGFSTAEIAGLTTGEIRLHQRPPQGERLGYPSTDADSWVMRVRHKSGVYGEFKLWHHTVLALEWATRRRRGISPNGTTVMVTAQGKPFNAP